MASTRTRPVLAPAVAAVRAAGGVLIADEVQPGFGRTGAGMWGFTRHGVAPDLVTMGKPMANGLPVAAMAARGDVLAGFAEQVPYFNTFGEQPGRRWRPRPPSSTSSKGSD